MNLTLSLITLSFIFSPFITTYYVRQNGGTPQQCNGKFDVDYKPEIAPNCAFKNVPDAITAVTYGDTVKLDKNGIFGTQPNFAFGEWALPDKGIPPTNTDQDYMTITTNDPSGTPAFLFNYPAERNKITNAMAANMPTVVAEGSTPLFRIKVGAKYWRIERLNIRNNSANGWQTVVFVDTDEIKSLAQVPHHIHFRYNWFHPDEEKGEPITALNIDRSAENGIFLTATDFSIDHNAFTGFQGKFRFGGEKGKFMTSAGILIPVYAERGIIENNYIDNWTYGFFSGGSSMPDWTVTKGARVVTCESNTVCTLDTTDGAVIGDPLAINIAGTWGSAFVKSTDGNKVTLQAPVCHSFDGGNTCGPMLNVPTTGAAVRFKGIQTNDILVRRNRFQHYLETAALMGGELCGKGDLEVKSGTNIRFVGNVFTCTGPTVTVRNQIGDFPWVSLDGLTFESNLYERSNRIFTSYFADTTPTKKSQNATWTNNLYLGLQGNTTHFPGGEYSGATTGGLNISFTHNTVAWSKAAQPGMTLSGWHGFLSFHNGGRGTMDRFVFRDNVVPLGINFCWNATQTATLPMTDCWPNSDVRGNVLVNADGYPASDISSWWPWANNKVINGYGTLFAAPNSTLTLGGDYRPASNGPLKGTASDGGDVGYNHQKLVTALGFDPLSGASAPTPSPTPVSSPSPVASPIPSPSPSPTATPAASPTVPLGSSVEVTSPANVREGATQNSAEKFIAPAGLKGTSGQCQQDPASVNIYCFVNFNDGSNGYVAAQFLKVVAAPTPTPTPSPVPTPTPCPAATPAPSPSPVFILKRIEVTAKVNIRSGPSISATSTGVANVRATGWTTGERIKDPLSAFWFIFVGFDDGRSGYVADGFLRII